KSSLELSEQLVHFVDEPGGMPELQHDSRGARAGCHPPPEVVQEASKQGEVEALGRGQLEEHRTKPRAQRVETGQQVVEQLPRLPQLLEVRDPPSGLEGKPKRLRRLVSPAFQHRGLRQAVEGVVDLYRREPTGVEGEHVRALLTFRVKGALPLGVAKP